MALDLDERQRAMLQEMGVRVWHPAAELAVDPPMAAKASVAAAPASTPAAASTARSPYVPAPDRTRPQAPPRSAPVTRPAQTPSPAPAMGALAVMDWPQLASAAASCQACGLCAGRKNTTLALPESPVQADWMVVSDPPDEDEDRLGQPVVEQAGVLLDNMLKAVGVSRSGRGAAGAYVSNVVKCRPPHGRIPQAAELTQCAAYLQREIALVQPKVIVAMGRVANQVLLSEQSELATLPLGKLRGAVYRYQGVAVVVTYHPKLLLRTSADKAKAWADLCLALEHLHKASAC